MGAAAIAAGACAAASVVAPCAGSAGWGLALSLLAIFLGIIGFVRAGSPHVHGGLIALGSIVVGALGGMISILVLVGVLARHLLF